ncbi:MAG: hypothetical protein IT349_17255 [Candidatus Eisenbacteria bacterium]|nr:hypothetical protein [Candidatus Eisenbacteria bacterium]
MSGMRVDIAAEHLEDAVFLTRQRGVAFGSHAQTVRSLSDLEERLLAHLDGAVLAQPVIWDAARDFLGSKDPAEAFVGGFLALCGDSPDPFSEFEGALSGSPGADGLRLACRLARGAASTERLERLGRSESSTLRSFALDAAVFRGGTCEPREVVALLSSEEPRTIRNGLEITARLRTRGVEPAIRKCLKHAEPAVAAAARRAGLLLGMGDAHAATAEAAAQPTAEGARALAWLAMAGGADAYDTLVGATSDPKRARAAFLALATFGHPGATTLLVSATADPKLGRVAGHALSALHGLDLKGMGLLRKEPARQASGDELDDTYLDDDFPDPDPERIRIWWEGAGAQSAEPQRVRGGQPLSWKRMFDSLGASPLPEREAVLLECRLRLPEFRGIESRGWVSDQERGLPGLRDALEAASKGRSAKTWPTLIDLLPQARR